ncbi:putative sugar-binding transport ATP-binding protein [Pyrococcus furiosus DSM 3638]|uniref:Molybdate/tungstate import ATP-binding protein WtpC n=3 Tax=Pyrococcus furiosus TaxID=2261 RepID=E7FHJ3_PYRFU|nr:ABC transporter ATP-binding protein [Pyrococcus furiosus]AAG45383.1 putative sugar-binding transport ATP-binding protein [Pyrococcus furiosus]AAL81874.1 putative sugar-binding transport ATP-binding protein [Pyrococcus furiosus DSM 3638]AFN04891.1 sugar-binding transport ATP-binding protein [Pyrococcus furiosus COM1]
MVRLRLEDIEFKQADFRLDIPFLEAKPGEFLTLLGPSGCGKTTTLRIIAGFEKPDKGKIYFDDTVMNDVPPYERNIGIVFQDYALFPHMTVYDNISFGLKLRKLSKEEIKRRVSWALELVGLKGFEDRYPEQLSGGQQQRVALARALVIEPQLLLLDEPLSNLDAKIRERLRGEIKRIQKELGITTIYVTHDQEEAMAISDRIAVMSVGKIEQVGNPLDLYYNPKNEFVARFLGLSNILEVNAEEGKAYVGNLCFEVKTEGRVKIFFRPESVYIEEGDMGEIVDYELLPGRIRLKIDVEGKVIIAERFLDEIPFSIEKIPKKVGIKVKSFSILSSSP